MGATSVYDRFAYPAVAVTGDRVVSALRSGVVNPFAPPRAAPAVPDEDPAQRESDLDAFMRGNARLGMSQGAEDLGIALAVRRTPGELWSSRKGRTE